MFFLCPSFRFPCASYEWVAVAMAASSTSNPLDLSQFILAAAVALRLADVLRNALFLLWLCFDSVIEY